MNPLPLHRLCGALAALLLASVAHAQRTDDASLPLTLRRGYVGPIVGPANDTAYARGALGLVRPGFGRASLFVAWRVMHLAPGAVARESHERKGEWVYGGAIPKAGDDELQQWLQARGAVLPQAPAVPPAYFRESKLLVPGFGEIATESGQCGPDAFAFATRTLRGLVADTSLQDADRRDWTARQDAVFSRCSWTPGQSAAPALPTPLPASAPARMKDLNAYQHASARFYGDEFAAARQEFEAIAARADHPMRPWATLGALRSIVRETVRDAEWDAAVADAWTTRGLRDDAFKAAVAAPAASRAARVNAALREIDRRATAVAADPTLAPVHRGVEYTMRRAMMQLAPEVPLIVAMNALDRPESNPYTMSALDLFQQSYPSVAPARPTGNLAARMRKHAWFDFIMTVQACADTTPAAEPAVCDSEHGHALARWQETRDNAWLLATLMTARQPSAQDLPAADAARAVPPARPEWASLQFYAAKVLRAQGRGADARQALDALAAPTAVHKRDRPLVEAQIQAIN